MTAGIGRQRGCFIVFEGLDRVGKSTQCQKLFDYIIEKGQQAYLMKFPDRSTQIGKCINEYLTDPKLKLSDHAAHLLFSANRWELANQIEERLLSGTHVITDRYAYSGVAYTSAKPGFSIEWCKSSDSGLVKPDLVIFLHLSPEDAQKRGDYGDERYEKVEFQQKVMKNFLQLKDQSWTVIDAGSDLESIHGQIRKNFENLNVNNDKLSKLWN